MCYKILNRNNKMVEKQDWGWTIYLCALACRHADVYTLFDINTIASVCVVSPGE